MTGEQGHQQLQEQAQPVQQGEKALWRAVVDRAIEDACGHCGGVGGTKNKKNIVSAATGWLKDTGRDMHFVCDLADINAEALKNRAAEVIERTASELPGQKKYKDKNVRYVGSKGKWARRVPA